MTKKITINELIQNAENAVDHTVDIMNKVHGPYWKSRSELAKLIISLSSAILVGTITFSSAITAHPNTIFPFLLAISWLSFFLTLLCGVSCLYFSTKLHTSHSSFMNSTPEIEEQIKKLDPNSEESIYAVLKIVKTKSDEAFGPLGDSDIYAEKSIKASIISFIVGLFFFIIFGCIHVIDIPRNNNQNSTETTIEQNKDSKTKEEINTKTPNNLLKHDARAR